MFLEYLGDRQATADSFTPDGWFMTGDRVTLETDGYITFSDRDKDMLKVGGENVAASEIERVIALVPGVYETAVVAQKHRMLDEVPVAFVIAAPAVDAAARAALSGRIIAECRAKLADFKVPRAVYRGGRHAALDAGEDPQGRAAQAAAGGGVIAEPFPNTHPSSPKPRPWRRLSGTQNQAPKPVAGSRTASACASTSGMTGEDCAYFPDSCRRR